MIMCMITWFGLESLDVRCLTSITPHNASYFVRIPLRLGILHMMADVRSLLRSERVSRRIDHPNALYSATGTLECAVCHISVKSDVDVWNRHLKSTQHAMRAERLRLSQRAPTNRAEAPASTHETTSGSKKRKASDDDEDSRKRNRPIIVPPGGFFGETIEANIKKTPPPPPDQLAMPTTKSEISQVDVALHTEESIDEAEWAAFERDVATPPLNNSVPSALLAQATISAAPVSAAELAAQEKAEERASGRETKEAEMAAEKEDAARLLEEEFDEMEGLEERVRRLREKREELRIMRDRANGSAVKVEEQREKGRVEEMTEADNADQEQSEDEEHDVWSFGR